MKPILVVDSPEALARRFASVVAEESARALAAHGRFSLAVSGGSVGELFLPALPAAAVDWPAIDVFWLDERAVPPDHPDSNYRQAHDAWLAQVPVDPQRVHRLRGEAADLEAAALAAERDLRHALGPRGKLDVALAGLGPDGHVASLFPGHAALEESSRWAVAVDDSPKPPPRRLTLTLRAFATDLLVVAAFGDAKASPVRAAIADPQSSLPIALAARRASRLLWLLDPGAASLLPS